MDQLNKDRTAFQYFKLLIKGMLMGAADAVPGVSGGTIAFITGIYEELIHSIRRFDLKALNVLFKEGVVAAWKQVNGTFLLVLVAGIALSIILLAKTVLFLLDVYPVLLWSFFFGLILASTWSVARHVAGWSANRMSVFALGVVLAYLLTSMSPSAVPDSALMVFFAGMIAICAMILPGISGSFILLLLGMYTTILTAIKEFDFAVVAIFAAGAASGLLAFSRVLSWAFSHYRSMTLALLSGFLLGSLNKVWPWKYTLSYTINTKGAQVPLVEQNVTPAAFTDLTGEPSQLMLAILLMLVGFAVVLLIDRLPSRG
jgi:putative membrane protein